mmetsp:Transcript_38106/g.42709  ORF Transcript_38106/g.42709 Transcript_38106/m.42709 type:complete len:827 (+) Transcript_38106:148-2628(+)|eukprot:CAMPEP_0170766716 /NCGR_PEP_ID=MMETSP0733-20121128/5311_1 /TAXON_ID=186038 /ORGANISM="Fragilariopsis kerguelensis, Strain L26-C5" /LENGTH=826 /DNA_ID=CAMNT_0011107701 /DNA_START=159 /DNA_END=2639 /DNA_ORIENTATION=-
MAGRFPFDQSGGGNPLNNPQVRAALGLGNVNIDEAVYLQRQQELQRDFQLRQLLLQEQLDQYNQQNRLENLLQEQQLKAIGDHLQEFPDLQQHYSRLLLTEQLQRSEERTLANDRLRLQAEEELRRRHLIASAQQQHQQQLQQHQQQQQHNNQTLPQVQVPGAASMVGSNIQNVNQSMLRDIAADSLAGNAIKRSDFDKRQFAHPGADLTMVPGSAKNHGRSSNTNDSTDINNDENKMRSLIECAMVNTVGSRVDGHIDQKHTQPSAQNLLDFATSSKANDHEPTQSSTSPQSEPESPRGSFGDLIEAALTDNKKDDAADILASIKKETIEWSESEDDEEAGEEEERQLAVVKGDTIVLPNFTSFLPQLPEEPILNVPASKKKKKRKFRGILDEDDSSVETKSSGKKKHGKFSQAEKGKDKDKQELEREFGDLPYPIDPWWPTTTSIKREKKALGESSYDNECDENSIIIGDERQFRANVNKINERLKNDVEPGVLEKIPHCRVHRMAMKKRKNPSAPELVYCTQVTELYPNDVMVCCSCCGTWRHTACGGHYKQYSIREAIDTPFETVCDRCYAEEKILTDHPSARKRLDRQRCEQIRRGLTTSAAMRQHSFSKHGGTYKWPLGSVSATHIGGHTRSVHSRHDKAEKQWTDMATKLGRGYGHRPKEKVKVRTKELERLLISIEDAEGHTDRHNMLVFLMQDTIKNAPVGFEKKRRNMFDPEDYKEAESEETDEDKFPHKKPLALPDNQEKSTLSKRSYEADDKNVYDSEKSLKKKYSTCKRKECTAKCRFDSSFCSDACGVSSLESDLLRTFFYSSDIHPSALRH